MIGLKILSTAAATALVLAMAVPTASFAEPHGGKGGVRASGGVRPGGATVGGAPMARYGGGGGVYRGGYRGGGFIPGAVAGAVIGGALAAGSYAYDGGPGYATGDYDNQYYNEGAVTIVQGPGDGGDDQVAYCMQTYRSYDPPSGTYLGFDGMRHPCP
jgi:hypothetical protein